MKRILISITQLALVLAMFAAFFSLTPWLGCRPLDELPSEQRAAKSISPEVVCFTDNHGQIAFHNHGLISQEPERFAFHVVGVIVPFGLLLLSLWYFRSSRRAGIGK
jgi:hypothetical protein